MNFPQEPYQAEKEGRHRIVAITVQTSRAVVVQKVIARLMSLARRDRIARSARNDARISERAFSNLSSKTRARSIIRPSRLVMTARIAPMPERRKTGATASWIACATRPKTQAQSNPISIGRLQSDDLVS